MGSGKDLLSDLIQYTAWKRDAIRRDRNGGRPLTGLEDYLISFDTFVNLKKEGLFENKKFADKLKDIVCMLINCTREQLEDRKFKETPLPEEWWCYDLCGELKPRGYYKYHVDYKLAEERYLRKLTPRLLLQLLGTEGGREIIHPNIWVNSLFSEFKPDMKWIITDVRFPNEADAVKNHGGLLLRIERPWVDYKKGMSDQRFVHPSETALDNYDGFDHIINNNGTIEDLYNKVSSWRFLQ